MSSFNTISQTFGYYFARVAMSVVFFFDVLHFLGMVALIASGTVIFGAVLYFVFTAFAGL